MLHLTNGRAIIPQIIEAGIEGHIVPWDDVLHEGPVPAVADVAAMRQARAEFLAVFTNGSPSCEEIADGMRQRDDALAGALAKTGGDAEVVLWMEHDLYDQLLLLQILDRLPLTGGPRVTAVPGDDYLGHQPTDRFRVLFDQRREIATPQRTAARTAWAAFRSTDPRVILAALDEVDALPHLGNALRRHLQQFPSVENGLSRTEQQALEAVAAGLTKVKHVYVAANHKREEAVFMGDSGFQFHLTPLSRGPKPLIARLDGMISRSKDLACIPPEGAVLELDDDIELTDDGRRVLAGEADRVASCGIDRWLGGVHLTGFGPVWRWNGSANTLRLG
jgi:hypothetical protein